MTAPYLSNINAILDQAPERPEELDKKTNDQDEAAPTTLGVGTGDPKPQKKSFASKMLGKIEKRLDKVSNRLDRATGKLQVALGAKKDPQYVAYDEEDAYGGGHIL